MNYITKDLLTSRFPPKIKYAFISNYVFKSRVSRVSNISNINPCIDLVLITENSKNFHIENYKKNKNDYPLISKLFKTKLINFSQKRGARIHYNFYKNNDNQIIRYSIIDWKDFENDMLHWKHLTASVFMQKPYKEIVNEDRSTIESYKIANLKSTIAYALLMMLNPKSDDKNIIIDENDLYRKILSIPMTSKSYNFFKLSPNIYDVNKIILDNIEELRNIYIPYIKELEDEGVIYNNNNSTIKIELSFKLLQTLINELPSSLITGISTTYLNTRNSDKKLLNKDSDSFENINNNNKTDNKIIIESSDLDKSNSDKFNKFKTNYENIKNKIIKKSIENKANVLKKVEDTNNLEIKDYNNNSNNNNNNNSTKKNKKIKKIFLDIHISNRKRLTFLKDTYNYKIRQAFIKNFTSYKQNLIENQLIRILNKHANSRFYLIFMSKWFFILYIVFKILIKLSIVYYIYKKTGSIHIPFISSSNEKNK